MAVRRRTVQADQMLELMDGRQVPVVSDEALIGEVVLMAQFLQLAGGVMSVVVRRHPTDMPQEMVTMAAVLEWKDYTDAKPQAEPAAPVPEPSGYVVGASAQVRLRDEYVVDDGDEPEEPMDYSPISPVEAAVRAVAERPVTGGAGGRNADDGPPPAASAEGINDGLEVSPEAEDVEAIPAEAR